MIPSSFATTCPHPLFSSTLLRVPSPRSLPPSLAASACLVAPPSACLVAPPSACLVAPPSVSSDLSPLQRLVAPPSRSLFPSLLGLQAHCPDSDGRRRQYLCLFGSLVITDRRLSDIFLIGGGSIPAALARWCPSRWVGTGRRTTWTRRRPAARADTPSAPPHPSPLPTENRSRPAARADTPSAPVFDPVSVRAADAFDFASFRHLHGGLQDGRRLVTCTRPLRSFQIRALV